MCIGRTATISTDITINPQNKMTRHVPWNLLLHVDWQNARDVRARNVFVIIHLQVLLHGARPMQQFRDGADRPRLHVDADVPQRDRNRRRRQCAAVRMHRRRPQEVLGQSLLG